MRLYFWRKPAVRKINWLEVAQLTLRARAHYGFYKEGTAEEMAAASEAAITAGASLDEAISAMEAACIRNTYYSTPHEHHAMSGHRTTSCGPPPDG